MDQNLKATLSFVDFGEAKLNIKDAVAVIEEFDKGLYLYISKNDPRSLNSLIPDWPSSEETGEFVFISADHLIAEVNGSLSVFLDSDINDPLARDASALYSFIIRCENSDDAPQYSGDITVVSGGRGERYLLPSTSRRQRAHGVQRGPEEPEASSLPPVPPVTTAAAPKNSSQVLKWAALVLGLLLLIAAGFFLWKYIYRTLWSVQIPESVVSEQNVQPKETPAEPDSDATAPDDKTDDVSADSDDKTSAADKTDSSPADGEVSSQPSSAADPLIQFPCAIDSSTDDKALLEACIRSNPQTAVLYKLGKDALEKNRCELSKRILTSVGRSGSQEAALMLGKLFDPNESAVASDCFVKDSQNAVYWYEKAKEAGESSESEKALENLKNAK